MTYRTILAVLASESDIARVTSAATRIGGGGDIHLIGCHGEPSQFVVLSAPIDVPDVATLTALYEEADARMRAVGTAFIQACTKEGLSHEWRPVRTPGGDSAISSLTSARAADLVIVRQPDRKAGENASPNFEALLFEGGRPVLFLPPDGAIASPIKRVLVAWDGSREATRAVQDAMPFLKAADTVEIVVVDPEKLPDMDSPLAGSDIAANLARHGVHANITAVGRQGRSTSEVIRAQLTATNADLLVMGAYTHNRIREWLVGGVTRDFMERTPVAVLMSR